MQILMREFERMGVPAELLNPIKEWGDETFRRCVCGSPSLFGSAR